MSRTLSMDSQHYFYSSSFPGAPPSQAMTAALDYGKPRSRPASITSVQTASTTSSTQHRSSSEDAFLGSHQTYSAYLKEQQAKTRPKNVNVYTTCGRHSNEWLFSGWFRK